jgi:hypothetical protein
MKCCVEPPVPLADTPSEGSASAGQGRTAGMHRIVRMFASFFLTARQQPEMLHDLFPHGRRAHQGFSFLMDVAGPQALFQD